MLTPLWTLPQEAKLYVCLAIVALVCRFDARAIGGAVFVVLGGFAISGIWSELLPIWLGERGLTCAILFAGGVGVALLERCLTKTIAVACFTSIAVLLLWCGHKETLALVAIAPVCVVLNTIPLPRWTAPKLDISYGVYLYALPIQHLTSDLPLSFWSKGPFRFHGHAPDGYTFGAIDRAAYASSAKADPSIVLARQFMARIAEHGARSKTRQRLARRIFPSS
ncbi:MULTISPECIES: hypothetical protein [Bradyrhizobium]|uniref:hypothetical protein n=1 Tax=Bradyrhizobium TaxID=374 RepID=UPI001FE9A749|nr:hypothetical protein [Bradyrhizobium canariense]